MLQIRLPKASWSFDQSEPLGPAGGFGAVYLGCGPDGKPVAVKQIHREKQHRAVRELNIAEYLLGHNHPHVIPILDAGRDASTGDDFIVMAQAQQSLQDLVDKAAPLAEANALEIIDAIASGLMEIGELVHRDLKPGNVLLHNGVWKLSDLGLARYVEDTTSANTMKRALSPQYAAPEQWRLERATKGTDVYALGCIIHALLAGDPPFPRGDLSHLHQFEPPLGQFVRPRTSLRVPERV
jgi:serine/threonine protein kinase